MPARGFDLNTASVDDFLKIEGFDRSWAQKIVDYRDEHGGFYDWSDLEAIPGFSARNIDKLKRNGWTIGGKKAA